MTNWQLNQITLDIVDGSCWWLHNLSLAFFLGCPWWSCRRHCTWHLTGWRPWCSRPCGRRTCGCPWRSWRRTNLDAISRSMLTGMMLQQISWCSTPTSEVGNAALCPVGPVPEVQVSLLGQQNEPPITLTMNLFLGYVSDFWVDSSLPAPNSSALFPCRPMTSTSSSWRE